MDPSVVEAMRARGQDPKERLARMIEADNAVGDGFPGVSFGVHLCRGNEGRRWHREGSYEPIAEQLFNQLTHQRLLLEYDTERAGDFSSLRFVPATKTAVLGLVTTKDSHVETRDELERRLDDAAKWLDLDHIAISPQCGFSFGFLSGPVSVEEQWQKVDVRVETVRHVWGGPA